MLNESNHRKNRNGSKAANSKLSFWLNVFYGFRVYHCSLNALGFCHFGISALIFNFIVFFFSAIRICYSYQRVHSQNIWLYVCLIIIIFPIHSFTIFHSSAERVFVGIFFILPFIFLGCRCSLCYRFIYLVFIKLMLMLEKLMPMLVKKKKRRNIFRFDHRKWEICIH